jgi:hypothetical protein
MEDITVWVWELPNGKFTARTSHSIQNAGQATPYQSVRISDSAELALDDAIRGLSMWIKPPYDKIRLVPAR